MLELLGSSNRQFRKLRGQRPFERREGLPGKVDVNRAYVEVLELEKFKKRE